MGTENQARPRMCSTGGEGVLEMYQSGLQNYPSNK